MNPTSPTTYSPQELNDAFNALPGELQDFIMADYNREIVERIAHDYHILDIRTFKEQVFALLVGLLSPSDFADNLQSVLHVSLESADDVLIEVDEELLETAIDIAENADESNEETGESSTATASSPTTPAPVRIPTQTPTSTTAPVAPSTFTRPDNLFLKQQQTKAAPATPQNKLIEEIEHPEPNQITKQVEREQSQQQKIQPTQPALQASEIHRELEVLNEDPFPMVVKPDVQKMAPAFQNQTQNQNSQPQVAQQKQATPPANLPTGQASAPRPAPGRDPYSQRKNYDSRDPYRETL
jgi:hypothetical protein